MCMSCAGMYVCLSTCMQSPQRPAEGIRSPGTGVTDGYKPPCVFWELNLGPLEEQWVLLTTEPAQNLLIFKMSIAFIFWEKGTKGWRKEGGRDSRERHRGDTGRMCPLCHALPEWGPENPIYVLSAARSVTGTAAAPRLWYLIHHPLILFRFVRGRRAPDEIHAIHAPVYYKIILKTMS